MISSEGVQKTLKRLRHTGLEWYEIQNYTAEAVKSVKNLRCLMPSPVPIMNVPIGRHWEMLAVNILQVPMSMQVISIF